ncbi:MAG: diiron oxygenase [Frankiaceae bacterium]
MRQLLARWDEHAGVRVRPRRILTGEAARADREAGLAPFPARLMPYYHHEGLASLSPDDRTALSARHLYDYLHYTVHLETSVVNPGVIVIAHGDVGLPLTAQTKLDALRIYCDEGYHALTTLDAVDQMERATGVPALPYDFAPRLRRLALSSERFLPDQPDLARLLQVVVFETVVTSILSDVPRDVTVYRLVREVVGDHARDEATHHAFFLRFFTELWGALPPAARTSVGRVIPRFIDDCLRPDLAGVRASLIATGVDASLADDVIVDCYAPARVGATVRVAARHLLRLCESLHVFDEPGAREALHELGLAG